MPGSPVASPTVTLTHSLAQSDKDYLRTQNNAYYYEVRVYVDQGNCAGAQSALDTFAAAMPTSSELPTARTYYTDACG